MALIFTPLTSNNLIDFNVFDGKLVLFFKDKCLPKISKLFPKIVFPSTFIMKQRRDMHQINFLASLLMHYGWPKEHEGVTQLFRENLHIFSLRIRSKL